MNFDEMATHLLSHDVCVTANFLTQDQVAAIRHDLEQQVLDGHFHLAAVGPQKNSQQQSDIRRDQVYWLEPSIENTPQQSLWTWLEELRVSLNHKLFLGLEYFEGHYSIYPTGGFYGRHLDSFRSNSDRIVSFVLYLNPAWIFADGGQLRTYELDQIFDVDPVGGTLVLFLSRTVEHEVLVTNSRRLSFTGWFKVRAMNALS